ncbi:MAG: YggS family pyridoxal phosphate-dependent enzyme [candidate division Zixibacteria bacterium]|nr:YggS family pyridoxal phosphate-dependent enzyme [candidate division Zixibacteria bacterium]
MPPTPDDIRANVARFTDELHTECARLNRPPDDITIVAVTKTFPAEVVSAATKAGLTIFGENRVQEAKAKISQVQSPWPVSWHLIGHFQTNKAKDAVALFDLIHSVDRPDAADALNHRAELADKTQDVLIQVNTTAEAQKSGCDPDALDDLVDSVIQLPHLRLQGLMTIGPFVDDPKPIAGAFQLLRGHFGRLAGRDLGTGVMRHCSMGMTDDWRIALAEGATMLRIGRALFGERS